MEWLDGALERHRQHGRGVAARLVAVFREWFESEGYRGCAFLNTVVELGGTLPEVAEIAKRHKDEVRGVIARLLPESPDRQERALAIAVALDGVIWRAQMERVSKSALAAFETILQVLTKG